MDDCWLLEVKTDSADIGYASSLFYDIFSHLRRENSLMGSLVTLRSGNSYSTISLTRPSLFGFLSLGAKKPKTN